MTTTTTTTKQDGHTDTVITKENSVGSGSTTTTYRDGEPVSAVSNDGKGTSTPYTSVSRGTFGAENSGTLKK